MYFTTVFCWRALSINKRCPKTPVLLSSIISFTFLIFLISLLFLSGFSFFGSSPYLLSILQFSNMLDLSNRWANFKSIYPSTFCEIMQALEDPDELKRATTSCASSTQPVNCKVVYLEVQYVMVTITTNLSLVVLSTGFANCIMLLWKVDSGE